MTERSEHPFTDSTGIEWRHPGTREGCDLPECSEDDWREHCTADACVGCQHCDAVCTHEPTDPADERRECLTPDYTDGPCHCAHCDPVNARRERYAAAILTALARDTSMGPNWDNAADAAMAVADEENERICEAAEFHQRRYVESEADSDRLKDELIQVYGGKARLKAENARLREEIGSDVNGICTGMHADVAEAQSAWREEREENARLRAELTRAEDTAGKLTADLVRKEAANEGLARALAKNQMRVERVREALAELNRRADESSEASQEVLSGTEYGWAAELLAKALNAPASVANPNRTQVTE
ncbi:hypothetical protein ACFY1A_17035 [Streptomyces sp. NPDC001520]|uniref:hypothetical protein n=1 Tax=Streptomyces sp. NPDC001520 TaxID=3364581 RepID=UPI00367389B9